jgi:hypothetical protein
MAKIDIAQFLGKPKKYTIGGQEISIEPLKGKDIDLLLGIKEGKEAEGVKRLVMHYFELTQDEIDQLPMSFLNEASEAIMDVNGLAKKKA